MSQDNHKPIKRYLPGAVRTKLDKVKQKAVAITRKRAIKNIEAECIYRGVDINDINPEDLEVLIHNEEGKIKSKTKNNIIIILLVALGFNV